MDFDMNEPNTIMDHDISIATRKPNPDFQTFIKTPINIDFYVKPIDKAKFRQFACAISNQNSNSNVTLNINTFFPINILNAIEILESIKSTNPDSYILCIQYSRLDVQIGISRRVYDDEPLIEAATNGFIEKFSMCHQQCSHSYQCPYYQMSKFMYPNLSKGSGPEPTKSIIVPVFTRHSTYTMCTAKNKIRHTVLLTANADKHTKKIIQTNLPNILKTKSSYRVLLLVHGTVDELNKYINSSSIIDNTKTKSNSNTHSTPIIAHIAIPVKDVIKILHRLNDHTVYTWAGLINQK